MMASNQGNLCLCVPWLWEAPNKEGTGTRFSFCLPSKLKTSNVFGPISMVGAPGGQDLTRVGRVGSPSGCEVPTPPGRAHKARGHPGGPLVAKLQGGPEARGNPTHFVLHAPFLPGFACHFRFANNPRGGVFPSEIGCFRGNFCLESPYLNH